ncbi:L,D-transpeptidase [Neisseriaceae bacterium ESL0693]|nr:L,D-transpeptidase [Neisseriaceae bacterium ESL0693]
MIRKHCITIGFILSATSVLAAVPVPDYAVAAEGQQVILNVPQLRLFLFQDGKLLKSYPMTVGKASTQTPLGEFKIGAKMYKPTWSVPKSIQKEMAAAGQPVQTSVPAGPSNPLGPVFVRLGPPKMGIGIHGTNAPASVPGVRSHGCVRLQSPNALDFANTVRKGADAAVIYQLASVNVDDNQQIWIQTYRNPYHQKNLDKNGIGQSIQAWAQDHDLTVNRQRLTYAFQHPNALICVTCQKGKNKIAGKLSSLAWTSGEGRLTGLKSIQPANPDIDMDNTEQENNTVEVNEDFSNTADSQKEQTIKPLPPQKSKPDTSSAPLHDHFDLLL